MPTQARTSVGRVRDRQGCKFSVSRGELASLLDGGATMEALAVIDDILLAVVRHLLDDTPPDVLNVADGLRELSFHKPTTYRSLKTR